MHKVNLPLSSVLLCPLSIVNSEQKACTALIGQCLYTNMTYNIYVKTFHRELNCNPSVRLWKISQPHRTYVTNHLVIGGGLLFNKWLY